MSTTENRFPDVLLGAPAAPEWVSDYQGNRAWGIGWERGFQDAMRLVLLAGADRDRLVEAVQLVKSLQQKGTP